MQPGWYQTFLQLDELSVQGCHAAIVIDEVHSFVFVS
jgi:hypothetical protein